MVVKCWKVDFMNGTEKTYNDIYFNEWKEPFVTFGYSDGKKRIAVTLRTSLIACIEEYYDERSIKHDAVTTTQTNEENNPTNEQCKAQE